MNIADFLIGREGLQDKCCCILVEGSVMEDEYIKDENINVDGENGDCGSWRRKMAGEADSGHAWCWLNR